MSEVAPATFHLGFGSTMYSSIAILSTAIMIIHMMAAYTMIIINSNKSLLINSYCSCAAPRKAPSRLSNIRVGSPLLYSYSYFIQEGLFWNESSRIESNRVEFTVMMSFQYWLGDKLNEWNECVCKRDSVWNHKCLCVCIKFIFDVEDDSEVIWMLHDKNDNWLHRPVNPAAFLLLDLEYLMNWIIL